MEFKNLTDRALLCTVGAADLCVWKLSATEAVIIDTGTVQSPELLQHLEENGLQLRAILQTHMHIDHVANNQALVDRYGCEVWACEPELADAAFCRLQYEYPVRTNLPGEDIVIDGVHFPTVFTPGHTEGHQMIVTPDGLCCLGDAAMSLGRIATAKVPFMRDITESLLSLEKVRATDYPMYLAAHKGLVPKEQLNETVDANIDIELRLYKLLRELVTEPVSEETLKIQFMQAAGLTSPRVMAFRFMHITTEARIQELIHAGELCRDGDFICPV